MVAIECIMYLHYKSFELCQKTMASVNKSLKTSQKYIKTVIIGSEREHMQK